MSNTSAMLSISAAVRLLQWLDTDPAFKQLFKSDKSQPIQLKVEDNDELPMASRVANKLVLASGRQVSVNSVALFCDAVSDLAPDNGEWPGACEAVEASAEAPAAPVLFFPRQVVRTISETGTVIRTDARIDEPARYLVEFGEGGNARRLWLDHSNLAAF